MARRDAGGGRARWRAALTLVPIVPFTAALAHVRPPVADSPPTLQGTRHLNIGATVLVTGAGWTGGDEVSVQLCGAGARRGTADCAQHASTIAMVWPDGTLHAWLAVARPPAPCPCVVTASSVSGGQSARTRVAV